MALSLLCGGLGVASAVDGTVHVEDVGSTVTSKEVYTTDKVDNLLKEYGKKEDVQTNKDDITTLRTTTMDQVKQIAINTTNIANNKDAIEKKIDTEIANATYATKDALNNLTTVVDGKANEADVNAQLANKADKTALDNKANKATTLDGYGITDAYTKTDANDKFATSDALNTAKTDLEGKITTAENELDGKITANTTKINANETAIQKLNAKAGTTETTLNDLSDRMVVAEKNITDLKDADVRLEGKIDQNANDINGLKDKDVELSGKINDNKNLIDQNKTNIAKNAADITNINGKLTTAEGNIQTNTDNINALDKKVGTINNGTYLDGTASVADNLGKLDAGLKQEVEDRKAADTALSGRIDANANTIAKVNQELVNTNNHFNTELRKTNAALQAEGQARANADAALANDITATNKRTAGIDRIDATKETTIEGNVTVDNLGNVKAKGDVTVEGKLKGAGLEAGAVNAGSLKVENASNLKGDVTMDKTLKVTGDTSLKKTDVDGALTVTGESSLKNTTVGGTLGVTGETKLDDKLTVKGEATFKDKVTMDKDLEVKGELKTDKIAMEHTGTDADGTRYNSATTITADGITHIGEVEKSGVTTKSSFTHNEKGTINYAKDGDTADWTEARSYVTASGVSNKMTDSDKNRHTYSQTATESMEQLVNGEKSNFEKKTAKENIISIKDKDAAGNVISLTNKQTVDGENTSVTNKDSSSTINQRVDQISNHVTSADGKKSSTEVKADGITNTSKDGTITNDAKDIVNNATGNMTNTVGGNQTNKIDGNQENTIGGSQTTIVTGDISNKAKNITNEAETKLTDKVGTNTRVIDSTSITDTVGTTTNRKIEDGKITDTAGDSTVTTKDGEGTTFAKTGSTAYSTEAGAPTDTNIAGNHITTGRVDANELGVSDKDGANTAKLTVEAGEDGGVKASASNGTTTGSLDVTAKEVGSSVKDDASGKGSTFKQRIDAIMGNVKTDAGESEVTQTGDEITSKVGLGEATNSRVTQKKNLLEAAVTDGTNYNISNDTANESAKELRGGTKVNRQYDNLNGSQKTIADGANTNLSIDTASASAKALTDGTKVNKQQDNLDSSEKTITNGTYTTSKLQTALDITNTAKDGTITNDAKNIVNNATGDMTNTVGGKLTTTVTGQATENFKGGLDTNVTGTENHTVTGDQNIYVTGNQTTTVTGDISNTAKNITNEANTKLTDKVGENTRVLDSEGITDTVGGSTFKQRIDKIMMESKDVSIKAEETLTNEAKVITNKASEVINNEAVNINNTATGIITSKASEIKNQADKLISNKVGENTWENMENGKITTSIKDGAKQNLTQSDAAGTTQSTVDGGKSTVTIQNADGLADAVTNGTNTSVQNQTASAIAAAVKDGAGNENASVANATTSVNTIKSGSKANTVISTADGTSFINSEAAAPVGDGTEVKTTIKGNTITTGKVTMDYAEVMKDLGVTGKTTTGSLEVKGESKLTGKVTMESDATVGGKLDVTGKATFSDDVDIKKNLSVVGDVTANSYKVGDKTYISADGINANNQKITNVADGSISEGSKDAVNGGQLYTVKNDLEGKVNKVGANAAAMANLHPMEFDPDSKWNIAAAIGNYGSETAAALGAFYRPNDDVMVNLSTAFGTGENMVGGGVSVRLGKGGNKLSREESNALKDQVNDLTARMDALLSVLNPNMSKDFPDVPENHWAYEAVSRLAGNDIVQGYPDGEFHGDRTMTRYEMAEIIYNALSRGAEAEKELVEEFKPELQAMAASEKATAERAEG